ncbi:MAG: hypothetical protein MZU91_03225 [Desulfosudis oleivorans]|nr:hypothetical protein [Desulfosudis oleivorans]
MTPGGERLHHDARIRTAASLEIKAAKGRKDRKKPLFGRVAGTDVLHRGGHSGHGGH